MTSRRTLFTMLAGVAAAVGGAAARAEAQLAPAPAGTWQSPSSGAELIVRADGSCALVGVQPIAGTFSWNATPRGGVLSIVYPTPHEPGRLSFDVTWVDASTITVEGEQFMRL